MCERLTLSDGTAAIICGVRAHWRRCRSCRERRAAYACDTCDAPICRRCRIHVPPDRDYCARHRLEAAAAAAALREARP